MIDQTVRHVYVHVPFCDRVCPFCSFDVRATRREDVDRYLDRLDEEMAAAAGRLDVAADTVYLGGGTPSQLDDAALGRLLDSVRSRLAPTAGCEVTVEVHPADLPKGRAASLVDLGFTRLSIGVQSCDDRVLRRLGRTHTAADGLAALDEAVGSGASVSADLIVAVAGQDWRGDLQRVADAGVHHLSAYTLTIEPGTPFARRGVTVAEDDELDALAAAAEVLPPRGLDRYEVSNHAVDGHRCAHNLAYWRNSCWVGLGPSAGGHEPVRPRADDGPLTCRATNARGGAWFEGAPPEVTNCDASTWWRDAVAVGLRLVEGVDLDGLRRRCGSPSPPGLVAAIDACEERGWVERTAPERLGATPVGMRLLDRVLAEIWT